jgi:hypothetical protein
MARRYWWYIFGSINGRTIALGKYQSESEAQTAANNINDWDSDWVVKQYRTEQLSVAKQMRKAELSQETGRLGLSLQPMRGRKVNEKNKDGVAEEHQGMFRE